MATTVYRPATSSTGDSSITGDLSVTGDILSTGTINTVGITSAANATAVYIDANENTGFGIAIPDGRVHVHSGSAGTVAADGGGDDLIVENSDSGGISILSPASKVTRIYLGNENASAEGRIEYVHGATANLGEMYFSTSSLEALRLDKNQDVLMGLSTGNDGKLHIDQSSSSGAIPVLTLDQSDVSEEFISFVGVAGTGNTVEAAAAKTLTVTEFLRVNVNGTYRYIQVGTIA